MSYEENLNKIADWIVSDNTEGEQEAIDLYERLHEGECIAERLQINNDLESIINEKVAEK